MHYVQSVDNTIPHPLVVPEEFSVFLEAVVKVFTLVKCMLDVQICRWKKDPR